MASIWVCREHKCALSGTPFFIEYTPKEEPIVSNTLKEYSGTDEVSSYELDMSDMGCPGASRALDALQDANGWTVDTRSPEFDAAYAIAEEEQEKCDWTEFAQIYGDDWQEIENTY